VGNNHKMNLEDLPAFAVEEISVGSDELRLRGHFSHLTGVDVGASFLYCGDAQWPVELVEFERTSRSGVFSAPLWVQRQLIQVGSVVPWLPGAWQFFHVNMILKTSSWERRRFVPSDAQHFRVGDAHGWTKAGAELGNDHKPTHVERDGWDHEECRICDGHIGRGGSPDGYVNQKDEWLCQECYEKYGRTKDLGFIRCNRKHR
jgi:hypothetical protein